MNNILSSVITASMIANASYEPGENLHPINRRPDPARARVEYYKLMLSCPKPISVDFQSVASKAPAKIIHSEKPGKVSFKVVNGRVRFPGEGSIVCGGAKASMNSSRYALRH